jgi:catechol 2,3-dioxygenase-like lactoylglutathione lyase family enzyme
VNLDSLDHVHFSVPDLDRAQEIYGPWFPGEFTPVYGAPELNAYGVWNMSGGDFIQVIDPSQPAFGVSSIESFGILSVSFRVMDIDEGITQAEAAGLKLRSRVGSEDIGMGKNVIQAQFHPVESFGLGIELVERQIPGDLHVPLNQDSVDYVEHTVDDLEAPAAFLEAFLDSPFDEELDDPELGARYVRNARFGIQLTAPSRPDGVFGERLRRQGPGLHAIAFQSRDLDRDVARARASKLELVRQRETSPGVREAEFAPESGVILRLVAR